MGDAVGNGCSNSTALKMDLATQSRVAIAVEEDCLSPPTHSVASEEIHLETATTAYALNWLHTCTDMLCRLFF